jgi:hypothetical protein
MNAASWLRQPVNLHRLGRVALVIFFAWLAARFWHPYYGFTRFLMMDTASAAATLPEIREAPIFLYADGYDGHYYAQLAARPAVNDARLAGAIDEVVYRARRILLSWVAWAAGGGDPVRAVRAYAWLNLALWPALAALLWRLWPCTGWRETAAWTGMMFSAGVLHSVRLALTDQLALLLIAGAGGLAIAGRRGPAAVVLGLGGLARETALLGVVTLFPEKPAKPAERWVAAGWIAVAVLPLAAWMIYLGFVVGWAEPGARNFMLPLAGWLAKWGETWRRLRTEPDHYLALTTLLAHIGLTMQAIYLIAQPNWRDGWWRLGAAHVALLFVLSTAVWEGHPGAATRVLLPLGLAFNIMAVRNRAAAAWLVFGNLTVLSGVLAMWTVPQAVDELSAGRTAGASYVVHVDSRWYPAEHGGHQTWAWCSGEGGLRIDIQPRVDRISRLRVAVRSIGSRTLEIRQAGRALWRGGVGEKLQWIELPAVAVLNGRAELELSADGLPVREGVTAGARSLSLALYGVRID